MEINVEKLTSKIGKLVLEVEAEQEKVVRVTGLLQAVCEGKIDPKRFVFTNDGFRIEAEKDEEGNLKIPGQVG